MTIRLRPARLWERIAALIGVILLLAGAPQLDSQSRTATTSLVLQVRPEELLRAQNGSVELKIRLARGATARLWVAGYCTSPSSQSHVIANSGFYRIPLSALTPVSNYPSLSTMRVCLASSDDTLHDSLPVEILGTETGPAVQGTITLIGPNGIPVDAPAGCVVTTRAGTTTWSNP